VSVDLVGHPFAPIGTGECLRASFRALRSVGLRPAIINAFGLRYGDSQLEREFEPYLRQRPEGQVQIYFINGDEVRSVSAALPAPSSPPPYRIIQPMWELAAYPRHWARELEAFDEVWAASTFIRDSIAPSVSRPVVLLPTPVGLPASFGLGRRHFRIPETSYAFLFAFDLRSYAARKNPQAAIEAFRRVVRARPAADCTLVLKVGGTAARPEGFTAFKSEIADLGDEHAQRVVLVEGDLTAAEITSLLWVCDAFVSLHRSEGFGRLLAEAMLMGKPVIATAYSGNVDFMTADDSLLVPYALVPVPDGAYPFAAGQSWAEPDVDGAAGHMLRLLDDPSEGRRIGERASRHMRVAFGHRAAGLRYADRIRAVTHGSGATG